MSERGKYFSSARERTTVEIIFSVFGFLLLPLVLILSLRKLWGFILYGFTEENSVCLFSLVFIVVYFILSVKDPKIIMLA